MHFKEGKKAKGMMYMGERGLLGGVMVASRPKVSF
jgi:hypothetical protein